MAPSGNFLAKTKIFVNFFGGGDPSLSPLSSMTCSGPFGKFFGENFFLVKTFFWGGVPPLPSPPLQHPLAACGRSGPFREFFGEKKILVKFFVGG